MFKPKAFAVTSLETGEILREFKTWAPAKRLANAKAARGPHVVIPFLA